MNHKPLRHDRRRPSVCDGALDHDARTCCGDMEPGGGLGSVGGDGGAVGNRSVHPRTVRRDKDLAGVHEPVVSVKPPALITMVNDAGLDDP